MVVTVNSRARHLIELLQLPSADLAYFPFRYLDLGIIAEYHYHPCLAPVYKQAARATPEAFILAIDKFITVQICITS
jgi:hypothetical protein